MSSRPLSGRTVLVTGGAVRVGRALALGCVEAGATVVIHYHRSQQEAEEARQAATAAGVEAHLLQADLGDPEAASALVGRAAEAAGRLDILVNNAALFSEGGLAEATAEDFDRQMALNLRAPLLLSQAFAAHVEARGGQAGSDGEAPRIRGRILNLLDGRIYRPGDDHLAYRLTKAGLAALTDALAASLAPAITVNALALGAILPPPGEDDGYLERMARQRVPLGRAGGTGPVVASALHLLTSDFLTGVTIRVDGGEFL